MSIIQERQIVTLVMIGEIALIVYQLIKLRKILKSQSWTLTLVGYVILAAWQAWRYLQISSLLIVTAVSEVVRIDHLTATEWIGPLLMMSFLALIIASYECLRQDLLRLGISL